MTSIVTQAPLMPAGITIRLGELRYLNGAAVHWAKTVDAVGFHLTQKNRGLEGAKKSSG